ncbi:MAG: hypothetical protein CL779_00730 [Chloroflexi bacterium]|nr:hypothetical protein [Chloroflexota bacterium]|tara:strand:- start:297 stop:503 length:207 start_codon:yes stop_codon:yes gene_type:complete
MKSKVEGFSSIYKDPNSGVVVNRASTDRTRYRAAKRQALQTQESKYEISELKKEMSEIKQLLHQLLQK